MALRTPSKPIRSEWGVRDFTNSKGLWVRTQMSTEGEFYVSRVTRAGALWWIMHRRIKTIAAYEGVRCGFESFQEFAAWCQVQVGYNAVDASGGVYEIDKDILYPSRRIYSPDTCRFVPAEVNCVFNTSAASRGEWPIGVSFHKQRGKFQATGRLGVKCVYLGLYATAAEAHLEWQRHRTIRIQEVLGRYSENPDRLPEIIEAIHLRLATLNQQIRDRAETFVL